VIASFEDGQVLWDAVVARGMEGVVAKRERGPYRPGARLWVKTKNLATARFQTSSPPYVVERGSLPDPARPQGRKPVTASGSDRAVFRRPLDRGNLGRVFFDLGGISFDGPHGTEACV
jgi:hypothetical protein